MGAIWMSTLFMASILFLRCSALSSTRGGLERSSKLIIRQLKVPQQPLHSIATDNEEVVLGTPDAIPSSFRSPFLQTLLERGFIHQCTDFEGLDDRLTSSTVSAYLGFDATANSLHVGSLLQVLKRVLSPHLCESYSF